MPNPKSNKKTSDTISQTIDDTVPFASLKAKLKLADLEIQNYVTALETENLKFQKKIGNLQAENVSLNSEITILKEKLNEKPNIMSIVASVLNKREHDEPPKK
jgi:hypothetical protein